MSSKQKKSGSPSTNGSRNKVGSPVQEGAGCGDNKPTESTSDQAQQTEKLWSFRISTYFDGTLNNKSNVLFYQEKDKNLAQLKMQIAHLEKVDKKAPELKKLKKRLDTLEKIIGKPDDVQSSFRNDLSNVARLEMNQDDEADPNRTKDPDHPFYEMKIYISGIGTEDFMDDDMLSAVTGWSSVGGLGISWLPGKNRGIIGKVAKACAEIEKLITGKVDDGGTIQKIEIDALGFSRGAAAARNFVHAVLEDSKLKLKQVLEEKGYTVNEVKVNFVGIFDTVASYGLLNKAQNTSQLHLDAIVKANTVVHLVANDEYRVHFPLINAKSKGEEISLPGCHSDVGGGYHKSSDEDIIALDLNPSWLNHLVNYKRIPLKQMFGSRQDDKFEVINDGESQIDEPIFVSKAIHRLNSDLEWFKSEGWVPSGKSGETHEVELNEEKWQLRIKRSAISNVYSFVPLHIMAHKFKKTSVRFTALLENRFYIDPAKHPVVAEVQNRLGPDGAGVGAVFSDKGLLAALRANYCHFSAHFNKMPSWPRFQNDGEALEKARERQVYDG